MTDEKEIVVRLHGFLSEFGDAGQVTLRATGELTPIELKAKLADYFLTKDPNFKVSLLESSAVGNNQQIFHASDVISNFEGLAILPPVCGG